MYSPGSLEKEIFGIEAIAWHACHFVTSKRLSSLVALGRSF
jgi:hypothetical protein